VVDADRHARDRSGDHTEQTALGRMGMYDGGPDSPELSEDAGDRTHVTQRCDPARHLDRVDLHTLSLAERIELRICELIVGAGDRSRQIARALLAKLRRESGADYVSAMAARGTPERRVLLRAGFVPAPRLGPILTVLPLNPVAGGLDPLDRGSWRASLGDLELF
jgi:hypothetical protein